MVQQLTDEQAVDEWFHRRGIPLMLDTPGRNARVASRMVGPLVLGWFAPWAGDALVRSDASTLVAIAVLLVAAVALWVAGNAVRRRQLLTWPPRIGALETVGFVVVPPLAVALADVMMAPAGEGLGWSDLAWLMAVQLVILALAWFVVRTGLVSLSRFLVREFSASMSLVGVAVARALPVMLGVVTFFFLAAEVWQSVGRIGRPAYVVSLLLFLVVAGYFLGSRFQLDLDALATFQSRDEVVVALGGTSIGPRLTPPDIAGPVTVPLDRSERFQLRLVAALSKLVVASIVAGAVFAFFLLLGVLVVDEATVGAWTTAPPDVLRRIELLDVPLAVTWQHLRVAGFLAVFSGFYFAVVSATDARLREGMRDTATDAVRQACAVKLCLESGPAPTRRNS